MYVINGAGNAGETPGKFMGPVHHHDTAKPIKDLSAGNVGFRHTNGPLSPQINLWTFISRHTPPRAPPRHPRK
jgi:hypothetical protein